MSDSQAYVPLARKWRPRTFEDVVGHGLVEVEALGVAAADIDAIGVEHVFEPEEFELVRFDDAVGDDDLRPFGHRLGEHVARADFAPGIDVPEHHLRGGFSV